MDAQARKKAAYRAKLNASKQDKRIESPLVRYNESDQPVCAVCNVVLKSEALWPAHQVSRKHHEAINIIKANAAKQARGSSAKPETSKELAKSKPANATELRKTTPEISQEISKVRSSSALPPNFFDKNETKKQNTGKETGNMGNANSHKKPGGSTQVQVREAFVLERKNDALSSANKFNNTTSGIKLENEHTDTPPQEETGSENKNSKGALPEGFFDDKDADLRARGIKPVKIDVKDEYKEFEKLIQEDLKEVDNRMEEEEFDAAENIEEAETVEQKAYWERVDMLRKKKMEAITARKTKAEQLDSRSSTSSKGPWVTRKEVKSEESSSDDDSDDNFTVDWRAKHM